MPGAPLATTRCATPTLAEHDPTARSGPNAQPTDQDSAESGSSSPRSPANTPTPSLAPAAGRGDRTQWHIFRRKPQFALRQLTSLILRARGRIHQSKQRPQGGDPLVEHRPATNPTDPLHHHRRGHIWELRQQRPDRRIKPIQTVKGLGGAPCCQCSSALLCQRPLSPPNISAPGRAPVRSQSAVAPIAFYDSQRSQRFGLSFPS